MGEIAGDWPIWSLSEATGECKYIRLDTGDVLLIDPATCASHREAAESRGVRRSVVSAGRVVVDRDAREVRMADRDSWTLQVKSSPGEQDAEAVREAIWGKSRRGNGVRCKKNRA